MRSYSFMFNDREVVLPTYSIKVAEQLENTENVNKSSAKFRVKVQTMYNVIASLIGKDLAQDLLGTCDESDPNDVNILYLQIVACYNSPFDEYNQTAVSDKFKELPVDALETIANAMQSINSAK